MTFQILALEPAEFSTLFALSDAELTARRARRVTATSNPGFPCRVSLVDAEVGDTLILAWHTHQPASSPYHASHAVYIREGAAMAQPEPDELPEVLTRRPISLRAFNSDGDMVAADLADGEAALRAGLDQLLGLPEVADVHLHNAKPGCYAARAVRA